MKPREIDKLFRDKISQRPAAPFDPDAWLAAKRMLEADRRRDRSWLVLLLLALIIGAGYWLLRPDAPDPEQKTETPISRPEMAGTPAMESYEGSDPERSAEQLPTHAQVNTGERPAPPPLRQAKAGTSLAKGEATSRLLARETGMRLATPMSTEPVEEGDRDGSRLDVLDATRISPGASTRPVVVESLSQLDLLGLPSQVTHRYVLPAPTDQPYRAGDVLAAARHKEVRIGWSGSMLLSPAAVGSPVQGAQFGFAAEYYLDKKWYLATRPSVQMLVNANGFSKFRQSTVFGFSATQEVYGLRANSLQFISIPVYLGHRFGQHQLELGMTADWLVAARGRLQQLDLEQDQLVILQELSAGWIPTDEMRQLVFSSFLGYKYAVTTRLSTGMVLFFRPGRIYPGQPGLGSSTTDVRWYMGLQATYYLR